MPDASRTTPGAFAASITRRAFTAGVSISSTFSTSGTSDDSGRTSDTASAAAIAGYCACTTPITDTDIGAVTASDDDGTGEDVCWRCRRVVQP